MASPVRFLTQVRDEMRRVIWPDRQEVVKLTSQVIAVSIFCAIFIGLLDYFFTWLTGLII